MLDLLQCIRPPHLLYYVIKKLWCNLSRLFCYEFSASSYQNPRKWWADWKNAKTGRQCFILFLKVGRSVITSVMWQMHPGQCLNSTQSYLTMFLKQSLDLDDHPFHIHDAFHIVHSTLKSSLKHCAINATSSGI